MLRMARIFRTGQTVVQVFSVMPNCFQVVKGPSLVCDDKTLKRGKCVTVAKGGEGWCLTSNTPGPEFITTFACLLVCKSVAHCSSE